MGDVNMPAKESSLVPRAEISLGVVGSALQRLYFFLCDEMGSYSNAILTLSRRIRNILRPKKYPYIYFVYRWEPLRETAVSRLP